MDCIIKAIRKDGKPAEESFSMLPHVTIGRYVLRELSNFFSMRPEDKLTLTFSLLSPPSFTA